MSKREKIVFVKELMAGVQRKLLADVRAGNIPENWDGHELRELLADRFCHERTDTLQGKRLRAYENTIIVNNL